MPYILVLDLRCHFLIELQHKLSYKERYPSPAEGACLESMCTGNSTVGSNPILSAISLARLLCAVEHGPGPAQHGLTNSARSGRKQR